MVTGEGDVDLEGARRPSTVHAPRPVAPRSPVGIELVGAVNQVAWNTRAAGVASPPRGRPPRPIVRWAAMQAFSSMSPAAIG